MAHSLLSILFVGILPLFSSLSAMGQTALEQRLEKQGMVRVQSIDPTIKVDLMYRRADNFTGKILYTDLTTAYLHPEAAHALKRAQTALKRLRPDLSLIVYDAVRPMSVQQIMYNAVRGTSKAIYVSNPKNGGGLHNYGLAVDITLCNANGDTLDMGTPIDYLGRAAHTDIEAQLQRSGRISAAAVANRQLLRKVMAEGGFKVLRTEWWHFNLRTRAEAKQRYKVVE